MRGNNVVLRIKLDSLKRFLSHVVKESETEIEDILRRAEEGEYPEYEDLDAALDDPYMRVEIAARAVYYEINALIEEELYHSAYEPWLESDRHTGPKSWSELTEGQDFRSLRLVTDVRFGGIVKLIEEKYNTKIDDLDGADVFFQIREAVNAFKHRGGRVDFRRKDLTEVRIVEFHIADVEKAYDSIEKAYKFIHALWRATGRRPAHWPEE